MATPSLRMTQKQIILKIYFILLNEQLSEIPRQARNDANKREWTDCNLFTLLVDAATTYPPETLPASGVPNALANVLGYKWEQNEM